MTKIIRLIPYKKIDYKQIKIENDYKEKSLIFNDEEKTALFKPFFNKKIIKSLNKYKKGE